MKIAQQSMQWMVGILRDLQEFFWLRVFPAPKQNPYPPTRLGKGADRNTQLAKETQARHEGLVDLCKPICGKQAIGSGLGYYAEVSISEEPCAIIPHAGICAGRWRVTALSTVTASHCKHTCLPENQSRYSI